MSHNAFTYWQSNLPPCRPEIKAEIIALGLHVDDLIVKLQGNYWELEELAGILASSLNTCGVNIDSIRLGIIPDNSL